MGSKEPGAEDKPNEKEPEESLAVENKPPSEQKHVREPGQLPSKSGNPAWRRALVPSLYIAGTGVLLYAAWKWLRPKDASKKPKSTWTLEDTLGPYR